MVDALLGPFDVTVEHGAVRLQPGLVDGACDLEPASAVGLVVADLPPDALGEDLGATSRTRAEPGRFEPRDNFLDGGPAERGEEVELNHRERLEVDPREARFERDEELLVVLDPELRMEAADDVQLADRLVEVALGDPHRLVHRPRPAAVAIAERNVERAQLARGDAHISRVEVPVDVVVGDVAMEPLADEVCEPSDAEQVVGGRQDQAILAVEPHARENLRGDRLEP